MHFVDLGRIAIELARDLLTLLHEACCAAIGVGEGAIDGATLWNVLGANGSHRSAGSEDFAERELRARRTPRGGRGAQLRRITSRPDHPEIRGHPTPTRGAPSLLPTADGGEPADIGSVGGGVGRGPPLPPMLDIASASE